MAKKRVKALLTIRVPLHPGICRWCRCTEERPCSNGCSWAERSYTLCSECVPLDKAMETAKGRQAIAEFVQDHIEGGSIFGVLDNPDYPRPRKKKRARR